MVLSRNDGLSAVRTPAKFSYCFTMVSWIVQKQAKLPTKSSINLSLMTGPCASATARLKSYELPATERGKHLSRWPDLSQIQNNDTLRYLAERAQEQVEMGILLHHIITYLGDEEVMGPEKRGENVDS
jgi:hypothetical protein